MKPLNVIEIKSWIAFGTILIILSATVAWGYFGTMHEQVQVRGVIVRSGRVFSIYSAYDAELLDFNLQPNQMVERDQVIARLDQQNLVREINMLIETGAPQIEIKNLQEQLISSSQIVTYDWGRVVDVYARKGDFVRRGQRLATISREAQDDIALETLLFVSLDDAMKIRRGMDVNVFPASVSSKDFGNMVGTVLSVSEYPVTFQYMVDILGSEELAREFTRYGAVHEVYVLLVASEETVTGYKWTTSLGPNMKFGSLTLTSANIILDVHRPIDVFLFGR
ncbi:MAG: HlyD family efflux transporter periplasmic adaptor subunit [Defluviitaleaceae bacterium]|nr:HlyD family efflux transporter periplasmic adaptor subunit [Defluviitaleaceae bacterium]